MNLVKDQQKSLTHKKENSEYFISEKSGTDNIIVQSSATFILEKIKGKKMSFDVGAIKNLTSVKDKKNEKRP